MNCQFRIVVVEDSETQALRLRHILEGEGWEVVCVANGEQALEELSRRTPDLIMVDYYLPGVRGDEFCRRIRMNVNTRGLLVMMLTSDETHDAELHGLESGADDFVPKSADTDILLLRVRTLLSKSRSQNSILASNGSSFRRARLLTIDDSPTYLAHLCAELEQEGYQVDREYSGEEGLRRLSIENYDCVLVDLVMPGIDGIEVCREINRLRQTVDNPIAVLMLTGRENKEDLTRALEAGADDFVGKSSDIAVLKGRIRALLRRKFFQEENRRILQKLKDKEVEALKARAEKELAEARAMLVEELEKTAAELQRSNRELEQFAYVVSHDLKEPLRMITSYTQLLADECQDKLGDEPNRYIHYAVDGASRMRQLIDGLLEYSRVGRKLEPLEPVDLQQLIDQLLWDLQPAIREADARVEVGRLTTVYGNRMLLGQLFQNLLGNALKFHGDSPPVVSVSCEDRDGHWEFAVADNGIGIGSAHFDRIFQVFQRIHSREQYPGTGIGLAVCRKIVEQFGGRIWVESTPGQGTTFRFTLPALQASNSALENEPSACVTN
ncbi:MAG: response regulator [Planctomycetaceae bacterium]